MRIGSPSAPRVPYMSYLAPDDEVRRAKFLVIQAGRLVRGRAMVSPDHLPRP